MILSPTVLPCATRRTCASLPLTAALLLTVACGRSSDANPEPAFPETAAPALSAPIKIGEVSGFATPESALYDAKRDVWYVSNINGVPNALDNNGFISRVSSDLVSVDTQFIGAGVNGVTLHAPKGMALVADTLWVADIDHVRGFNVITGAAVASIPVEGAVFLNDMTPGGDGTLYISDTGIRFGPNGMAHPGPDRIFALQGRAITEALRFVGTPGPNGLLFGAEGRLLIVSFASTAVYAWLPGTATADSIASGPGQFDGVVMLGDGRVLVSSWADSTVHVMANGMMTPLIRNVPSPADLGLDSARWRLAIPLFNEGRVEFWDVRGM